MAIMNEVKEPTAIMNQINISATNMNEEKIINNDRE
jgi:hypothetical protein